MTRADPDDQEARRIKARSPEFGKALFNSVFDNRAAQRLFNRFQDADDQQRVLTINSQDASILALPWQLLHDPSGNFLFQEKPHISVRRKISRATGGRQPFRVESKDRLHLLFVVSRPTDAGFIDPRADPRAVLDALENHAAGRVTWELLRPATDLADVLTDQGKYPEARAQYELGLAGIRQVNDPRSEGAILGQLGRSRTNLEPTGDREQVSRKARGSGDLVSQNHRRRPENWGQFGAF